VGDETVDVRLVLHRLARTLRVALVGSHILTRHTVG
jgi:hypothetical protein